MSEDPELKLFPRKIRNYLIMRVTIIYIIVGGVSILMGFAFDFIWVAFLLWGLNGFFQSMGWAPSVKTTANWFPPDERGKWSSRLATSYLLGGVVSWIIAIIIIDTLKLDWRLSFIVPGIICAVIFSLIAPIIILENQGIIHSLSRSQRLVSRRWLKTFVLLFLVILLTIGISSIGNLIDISVGSFGYIVSAIVTALIYPIHAIAITYYYYSMRAREKQEEPRSPKLGKYCIQCGVTLNHIAVYCPTCGARQPT